MIPKSLADQIARLAVATANGTPLRIFDGCDAIKKHDYALRWSWGGIVPTVLRVHGYRFFFFSNEGTEPAHIHVKAGENYAKFWLHPLVLVESIGYNARELRALHEIVASHQEELESAWNDFFKST